MANVNRDLPNVYTTLNDMSALIEGEDSLIVGVTLRSNRGPMNVASNITDSSDFLTRYTFTGKPGVKQDSTYFDIIELLKASRNIYVSRAANNPLYGGLIVKKEVEAGAFIGVTGTPDNYKRVMAKGDLSAVVKPGQYIRIAGENLDDEFVGRRFVESVQYVTPNTQIMVSESFPSNLAPASEDETLGTIYVCTQPVPITSVVIADKYSDTNVEDKSIAVAGQVTTINAGDRVKINNGFYTVASVEYSQETVKTTITFNEDVVPLLPEGEDPAVEVEQPIYLDSLYDPNTYQFQNDDLFLVAGIDQGAYNSSIGIDIESCYETELTEPNSFNVTISNLETNTAVEEYLVSMSLTQKSTDGTNMHIKDIINPQSQYVQIYTPDDADIDETAVPASTSDTTALGGGSDGGEITIADNIAALQVFADKSVPVSLLVNGDNENALYQAAMIAICESRLDCFAFLRTPKSYEKLSIPSQRVTQLINYKKNTLATSAVSATSLALADTYKPHFKTGSTSSRDAGNSYMAAIYGPHVTVTDMYNSRNVVIGADSVACRQWIQTINNEGYPYAAAGPLSGTVRNLTVDWKIGDESAEARQFNDASMNMIVYEARQQYYYFNTQNTLQLANSAFRNVGAVLNVLDIKESLARRLKQYIQRPISDDLIEAVERTITDYMDGCKSGNRVSNYVLNNNTTKNDISNNELHFMLTLAPAYYAQKIYLVVNVVNAAFDFEILQSV